MKNPRPVKRAETIFYRMRLYHNWIKRQLLNKYARGASSLLDLCCGKGGDLDKWIDNKIKYVLGYDINSDSIIEAKTRLKEKYVDDDMRVEFRVMDLAKEPIAPQIVGNVPLQFDVVTSMFAFHYMFATEESFETILTTIKNNLKIGGWFIGCLFDNKAVTELLVSNTDGIENDRFESPDGSFRIVRKGPHSRYLFGNRIEVFMNETVLDAPTDEFLVDFDQLVEVFYNEGLILEETSMFDSTYATWKNEYGSDLSPVQQRISFLNRSFVFKRIS